MARIGFIGLGNMGGGMAANLVKAGHAVNAFDLSGDACARARDAIGAECGGEADADASSPRCGSSVAVISPYSVTIRARFGSF